MKKSVLPTLAFLLALPTTALAQVYSIDDGTIDDAGEVIVPGASIGFLQAFSVPGGGQDTINTISFITGAPSFSTSPNILNADGAPLSIAVWSDPNGDGNPNDAVLLGSTTGLQVYNAKTGLFATHSFSPPIQVTGAFFAGYTFQTPATVGGWYSVGATDSSASPIGQSYRFANGTLPVDLQNLQANAQAPNASFVFGVHMLRLNDDALELPVGTSSCESLMNNSYNRKAVLYANGNIDQAQGGFSLALSAGRVPTGQAGYFLAAAATAAPIAPTGSQGLLCLGGMIHRIRPSAAVVGNAGTLQWRVDVNDVDSLGAGLDVISAGQSWSFQAWYRDVNPTPTSNFSNMVTIPFN